MTVHRWDLGQAVGSPVTFTDDELDRIEQAVDGLGEMLYSSGACKPPLEVPDDAPRQQRVLGRLGAALSGAGRGQPTRTGCRTTASNR